MTWVADTIAASERLFSKRGNLLNTWQSIAEQFSPWCADYTDEPTMGDDYASDLMTSYPILMARELTDLFGPMLRPSDQVWAQMEVEGLTDWDGKRWLEWATGVQRRAMYDRPAQFLNATKAGDRDFALMGQAVLTVDLMPDRSSLLYRQWHLRDTVWTDSLSGEPECVYRRWKPTAYQLAKTFGEERLHPKVKEHLQAGKDRYCDVKCLHVVIPADMYDGDQKFMTPLVELYIDIDNEHVIEATGQRTSPYVIPRWVKIPGTQYALSPATWAALPETRLLQAMTFTLLEAGEKAVRPPLVATAEAIRGDIDVQAGGITWVAAEYDEKTGEVLRPLTQDLKGFPVGLELQQRSELMIRSAFYLDKLDLPVRGKEMTAYEVAQRVQQQIRTAAPLFEPMEMNYNNALCDRTFDLLVQGGGFGSPDTWPDSLQGQDIRFRFVSPLRDAIEKQKGQIFLEAGQLIGQAVSLDPNAATVVNASEALRDALAGIGAPTSWTRSREDAEAANEQAAAQEQQAQLLSAMEQGSTVVKNLQGATV